MIRYVYASPVVPEQVQYVFQENQSAMNIEVNGSYSCSEKSWHIYITYFFMKDWVEKEELCIVYFPTHIMLANYLTNPLQGALLHNFREILIVIVNPITLL